MTFHSYFFIFVYLPLFLLGIYGIQTAFDGRDNGSICMKLFLILSSGFFFVFFGKTAVFAFAASIIWNICFGVLISRRGRGLIPGVLGNVLFLCFFKYKGSIAMPVAISFYTFQQIAFLVQLHKKEIDSFELSDYLCYILFFPKIVQGPLADYKKLTGQLKQLVNERISSENIYRGLILFTIGLAKKVLLSDALGAGADFGFGNISSLTGPDAVITALCYSLQLYFDFSGYCDMAEGICRMIGIYLDINFRSPYKAANIAEFWDRWHITLTNFFTRYVYIPLGGSRRGRSRTYINILIVFLLSGIWHGAGLTFIIWGMLHGGLMVLTRIISSFGESTASADRGDPAFGTKVLHLCKVFLTFCYVTIAWVFFRSDTVGGAVSLLKSAISPDRYTGVSIRLAECFQVDELWYVLKVTPIAASKYGGYVCMWIILALSLMLVFAGREARDIADNAGLKAAPSVVMALLFVWCTVSLGGVSTFLYVNF